MTFLRTITKHAFVSHDLIWNLIPIDKRFNSSKSDKLPSIDEHFDKFFNLQKIAFEIVHSENPKSKLIEDYLTIFPKLETTNDFEYFRYKCSYYATKSFLFSRTITYSFLLYP